MPALVVAVLLQLGCRGMVVQGQDGSRIAVWVCPAPIEAPADPVLRPEEREG